MRSSLVLRVRIICGFFIAAAIILSVRLYFVQIVHGDEYRSDATSQYVESSPDTEDRGTIYFTTKDGTLVDAAIMQTGWRIAMKPGEIDSADALYGELNAITPIDRDRFNASAAKKDDPYEEIAFRVDDDAARRIRSLDPQGVILVQDQWRAYPAEQLAAQTIGFVGYQGNKRVGVYGLERYWEDTLLKKKSGLYVNPFAEMFANVQALVADDPAAHAGSLITSIEPKTQQELEDTLDEVMRMYAPRIAGAIIMDPKSGEIVAMAVRPTFDPNNYNLERNTGVFSNPLVEGVYEMGSIMKPLTMAAGIDAGAVGPTTKYEDRGCITKSTKKICNFDFKARGVVPMQEVLSQSLNTGVSFVVDKMGHARFAQYVHAFGLGESTGIDLPNEAVGQIDAVDSGVDVDSASASFGQGIAVSGVEMIRALSALANEGKLAEPHVVTGIKYDSGITRKVTPQEGRQVIRPESALAVTDMLVKVFDDALLKGELKQERYSIAAKTGTAQIAIPGGGGYYGDRYLHSFFGYFPAYEPKFIVFLFAVEPNGAEFASATLARPFMDMAQFLINYYDIPPDR